MAARWRGEDGDLNVDNSDFLATNISNEVQVSSYKLVGHRKKPHARRFRCLIGSIRPAREATCGCSDTWLNQASSTTEAASRVVALLPC